MQSFRRGFGKSTPEGMSESRNCLGSMQEYKYRVWVHNVYTMTGINSLTPTSAIRKSTLFLINISHCFLNSAWHAALPLPLR